MKYKDYYPLQDKDMIESVKRQARGESCNIPIRADIHLKGGYVSENCLTWGSPYCYWIIHESGLYYGVAR